MLMLAFPLAPPRFFLDPDMETVCADDDAADEDEVGPSFPAFEGCPCFFFPRFLIYNNKMVKEEGSREGVFLK